MGGMDSSSGRAEMAVLSRELERLREENARLSRLLDLRGWDTAPAAEQPVMPLAAPGMVTMASSLDDKLRLYADRFRARRDVYAVRWENARSGLSGWSPAVAGGWRKGADRGGVRYLPLTPEVLANDEASLRNWLTLIPAMRSLSSARRRSLVRDSTCPRLTPCSSPDRSLSTAC